MYALKKKKNCIFVSVSEFNNSISLFQISNFKNG